MGLYLLSRRNIYSVILNLKVSLLWATFNKYYLRQQYNMNLA